MTKTIIANHIGLKAVGYMINTPLSRKNQLIIGAIQHGLKEQFDDSVWLAPANSLHITLLDWLAPLVDYGQSKDYLFKKLFQEYDQAIRNALHNIDKIEIKFNKIIASQTAIYLSGDDRGQFARIRESFIMRVELLSNTKLPPTIIHTTIVRFNKGIDLAPVQNYLSRQAINMEQTVNEFRLVREIIDPMLEYEIIKHYKLK